MWERKALGVHVIKIVCEVLGKPRCEGDVGRDLANDTLYVRLV